MNIRTCPGASHLSQHKQGTNVKQSRDDDEGISACFVADIYILLNTLPFARPWSLAQIIILIPIKHHNACRKRTCRSNARKGHWQNEVSYFMNHFTGESLKDIKLCYTLGCAHDQVSALISEVIT